MAPFWSGNALREEAETWADGLAYRLHVRGDWNVRYGMQLEVLDGRLAEEDDAADGYDFRDLVESSDYDPEQMFKTIHDLIERYIDEPCLKRLVRDPRTSTPRSSRRCPRRRTSTTATRPACSNTSGA